MLPKDSVVHLTRRQFDLPLGDSVEVEPIEKGGSDRSFYRITLGERSLILVRYGGQKEENRHYVAAAKFLEGIGVNVPRVHFHDPQEGLIWMQDLGADDLWAYRDSAPAVKLPKFEAALDQAFLLHTRAMAQLPASDLTLQKEFTAELYQWEQRYFLDNCVGKFFEIADWDQEDAGMQSLADELAALPRVLVHRDFQSQNVMVLNDEIFLIDFQGMRPGLAQYDLASLLYDPYTDLADSEREHLLNYYIAKLQDETDVDPAQFRKIYYATAAQRLMQALGAYGYLGLVCERSRFLSFIPVALPRLAEVLARLDDPRLSNLRGLVDRMLASKIQVS